VLSIAFVRAAFSSAIATASAALVMASQRHATTENKRCQKNSNHQPYFSHMSLHTPLKSLPIHLYIPSLNCSSFAGEVNRAFFADR
jgi:hypothetical protein